MAAEADAVTDFNEAAQRLGIQGTVVDDTAGNLARTETADGPVAIHRLEEGAPANHAAFMVDVLGKLGARAPGLVPSPLAGVDGVHSVEVGGRQYLATSWIAGRPLARYGDFKAPDGSSIDVPLPVSAPADEIVLAVARLIGELHVIGCDLAPAASGPARTMARIYEQSQFRWSQQRRVIGTAAANVQEIRRWLRCGNRVFPAAEEYLAPVTEAVTTVIHGNLWPAHILVEGTSPNLELKGLVGWHRMTVGTPLDDLASLVTHTSGWSGARAEQILGAYTEIAPLSPIERRLLPVIAALDLVPRVGSLLHLDQIDDRMIGGDAEPVLRSATKSLLHSLENLTNILAPEERWEQRQTRVNRQERQERIRKTPRPTRTTPGRQSGSGRSHPGSRRGKPKAG